MSQGTPEKRVEIVHRELGDKQAVAQAANTTSKSGTVAHPKTRSHWAIRVENEPGQGIEDDLTTWSYFGLIAPNKAFLAKPDPDSLKAELSDEKFTSLDSTSERIKGYTTHSLDTIGGKARDLISGWGNYDILRNNCQDFAIILLCQVAWKLDDEDAVRDILCSGPLRLTTQTNSAALDFFGFSEVFGSQIVVKDRKGKELSILGKVVPGLPDEPDESFEAGINDELFGNQRLEGPWYTR